MNALLLLAAASAGNIVLQVIFWILLLLCVLGIFAPEGNPWVLRGRWGIVLILIAILGLAVFGNPVS
jgi:hypothetical protein